MVVGGYLSVGDEILRVCDGFICSWVSENGTGV